MRSFRSNCHLKSNMDRFIEMFQLQVLLHHLYLKSNMDRFIDNHNKDREKKTHI